MGKERKEGEEANEGRVGYLHIYKDISQTMWHSVTHLWPPIVGQNLCLLQWSRKYCHPVAARAHPLSQDWCSRLAVPPEEVEWRRGEGGGEGGREEEQVIIGVSNLLGETHTKCCYHWNRSGDYRKLAVEPGLSNCMVHCLFLAASTHPLSHTLTALLYTVNWL